MSDEPRYEEAFAAFFGLLWGDGFMTPGQQRNMSILMDGLDIKGKRVLDIGCGGGGPALLLVEHYGANLVGIDMETALIEAANRRARERGLQSRADFRVLPVTPGLPDFRDESFDVAMNCGGAFIHLSDKQSAFADCWRVLKPGGMITGYEWMSRNLEHSRMMDDAFVDLEPIFMEPLSAYGTQLEAAGFVDIELIDDSLWYREEVKKELEKLTGKLNAVMRKTLGDQQSDNLLAFWRVVSELCDNSELVQGYFRARKSHHARLQR